MKYRGKSGKYFEVVQVDASNCHVLKDTGESELMLLWLDSNENRILIDAQEYIFNQNEFTFLTQFHHVEIQKVHKARIIRFNRPFYCILDHDAEIGCAGILYYGAAELPRIHPTNQDLEILQAAWNMLRIEMESRDNLQLERLQTMLKRILILCTRVYKSNKNYNAADQKTIELIKQYNFNVEQHFRKNHTVAAYADMLIKSPKTLSNLFKKIGEKNQFNLSMIAS